MMWHSRQVEDDPGILRWSPMTASGRVMSFDEVVGAWRESEPFRATWLSWLSDVPYDAYCWECPPVSESTRDSAFECVFVPSPSLARMGTDADAFAEHFRTGCDVVTFDNLGGDATLVAPCPEGDANFAHLGSFTATASADSQDAFWQAVGEAVASRIGPKQLWLSTAGHGIAWLHVRLDSRPKYYRHAPYMRI